MTNRPPSPATGADFDTAARPDPQSTGGRPRWVNVLGIIALVLAALLFVGLKVTGLGGDHGPGRHNGGGGTPSSSVSEDGAHTPPAGMNHG